MCYRYHSCTRCTTPRSTFSAGPCTGLRTLGKRFELSVTKEECLSNPLESAALLANLAFSKVVLRWLQRRNPLGLLVVVLPPFVVVANLLAWLLSRFVPNDDFMPHGFSLILQER